MKKFIMLAAAILLPLIASAQAQIITKKVKVGDFTEKVTKVVIKGSTFYDIALQNQVAARWRISPYEFCTLEEFEKLKTDDQYYFLIMVSGQFKKELSPGVSFLTLVKGGEGAEKGISDMLEVVSVPFASVEDPSGREFTFLPALLDIMQDYTLASIEKDYNGYGGLTVYAHNIAKSKGMNIVFSENDLYHTVNDFMISQKFDDKMTVTDEDGADKYMSENAEGTLVSYVVAPTDAVQGSNCYRMLIDAKTHELYYFRKHRIGKKNGAGFIPEDINRISQARK